VKMKHEYCHRILLLILAVAVTACSDSDEAGFRVKIAEQNTPSAVSKIVNKSSNQVKSGLYKELGNGVVYGIKYSFVKDSSYGPVFVVEIVKGQKLAELKTVSGPEAVLLKDQKISVFKNGDVRILFESL